MGESQEDMMGLVVCFVDLWTHREAASFWVQGRQELLGDNHNQAYDYR